MIHKVGKAFGESVVNSVGRLIGRVQERRPLSSDLLESTNSYLIVFDAPGVTTENTKICYENGAVHVCIDRYQEYEPTFKMRFPGRGLTLSGRRALPDNAVVNADASTATLHPDGTVQVHVPKQNIEERG